MGSITPHQARPSGGACTLLLVREPVWGIIFQSWHDEPVYHRLRPFQERIVGQGPTTACGRTVGYSTPMLPFKHVKKIGRPCKGCFDV